MKNYFCIMLIFLGSCVAATSYGIASEEDDKIVIIYSGNLNGELEPCGCTKEGDLGGIRRRATMLERLREQHPDLFLISAGGLLAIDSAADRIKNKYILKGMRKLGYDAIGVQSRDLLFGPELLNTEPLPWVASNRTDDRFKSSRHITRNKTTISFFSWMDPQDKQLKTMQAEPITAKQSIERLLKDISRTKQKGNLIVLSTTQTLAEFQKTIGLKNIDILLIKAAHEIYGPPQQVGPTLVLQPGSRGMRLGQVNLLLDNKHRIKSYQHKIIELPTSILEAADYDRWYEDYNEELKQDYFKRVKIRQATETGKSPYTGAKKCQSCHQAAWQTWQKTRHAHAFPTLQKVNKSFDPNCIGCHTVGFEKAGGFMDEHITPQLMNVQCESCHGSSGTHVTSNGIKPVENKGWSKEKMCRQCHVGSHSPLFEVNKYWPKIEH